MEDKQATAVKPEEKINPKYAEFKTEENAYLESVNDLPLDDVLKKELNTILPGLFKKYFPHRIRERRDLDGVFELKFVEDKVGLKWDKDFMDSLKYEGVER